MASTECAHFLFGLVLLVRDLAEMMHTAAERDELIEPGEVAGFVTRLDLLGNCLCERSDEFSAALRMQGVSAPPGWGGEVHREPDT
jgi:hypothetical protein